MKRRKSQREKVKTNIRCVKSNIMSMTSGLPLEDSSDYYKHLLMGDYGKGEGINHKLIGFLNC